MNIEDSQHDSRTAKAGHREAVDEALSLIPPLFPLRQFVAVNPFLGFTDTSFEEAAARLVSLSGTAPLLRAEEYLALFAAGEISRADLQQVTDATWSETQLVEALKAPAQQRFDAPWTAVDALESERPSERWREFVVEDISKWCGAYYDENQVTWKLPWAGAGLWDAFRRAATVDRAAELHGLRPLRSLVAELPEESSAAIEQLLRELAPAPEHAADFVYRELSLVSGWAAYCRYLVREQELRGASHPALLDLLAIRLAYDVALLRLRPEVRRLVAVPHRGPATVAVDALCRWQAAYEIGWQRQLGERLISGRNARRDVAPVRAHAVFCIDVRSEVLRRHLEATSRDLRTLGFAGFFGFALSHRKSDGSGTEARCPALLVPSCESAEAGTAGRERAVRGRSLASTWKAIQNAAASCFSLVETAGAAFAAQACSMQERSAPSWQVAERPELLDLTPHDLEALAARAEGALRNMSLTHGFGRLLLLCGHGSHSANNPFAAGLDCGACGGHAGDVNARVAAQVLNHPGVRERLARRGIELGASTWVVAGLHDTMTDEVHLFDLDLVPASHREDIRTLERELAVAGDAARRERAQRLGLEREADLLRRLRDRAKHVAETRPEWGLAGNAALIVAPRSTTSGWSLEGRAFLHEYRHDEDPDGAVLSLILSAPVVVASWINLQYYASRVDPARYGAGNKVLHNVVGGIGVFEGNGGDLRTGLPLQSIHDGERFVHEPRRLSVFIEAPREKVQRSLASLPAVKKLFDGGWIHLLVLDDEGVHTYSRGRFHPFTTQPAVRRTAA